VPQAIQPLTGLRAHLQKSSRRSKWEPFSGASRFSLSARTSQYALLSCTREITPMADVVSERGKSDGSASPNSAISFANSPPASFLAPKVMLPDLAQPRPANEHRSKPCRIGRCRSSGPSTMRYICARSAHESPRSPRPAARFAPSADPDPQTPRFPRILVVRYRLGLGHRCHCHRLSRSWPRAQRLVPDTEAVNAISAHIAKVAAMTEQNVAVLQKTTVFIGDLTPIVERVKKAVARFRAAPACRGPL
jgi:hypothetical protein